MKRFATIAIVATLVLALLSGCAQAPGSSQAAGTAALPASSPPEVAGSQPTDAPKKIGIVMIDLVNPFFAAMMEAGDVAAEDFGVETIWKSCEGSIEKEIALVENFIGQVDVIVVDPLDVAALTPTFQKVVDAGIPIVTAGAMVEMEGVYNTLYDDYNDTHIIATTLAKMIGEEGKVALIYGNDGNYLSDQRKAGFEDAMAAFPDITIFSAPSNWDAATGLKAAQDLLAANPDIKAIHCVSGGVGLAVMQLTKDKDIILSKFDGLEESIAEVEAGNIAMDLLTGIKRVGYFNVKTAAALAHGEALEPQQRLPTFIVASPELEEQMVGWGIVTADKVISPAESATQAEDLSDLK